MNCKSDNCWCKSVDRTSFNVTYSKSITATASDAAVALIAAVAITDSIAAAMPQVPETEAETVAVALSNSKTEPMVAGTTAADATPIAAVATLNATTAPFASAAEAAAALAAAAGDIGDDSQGKSLINFRRLGRILWRR